MTGWRRWLEIVVVLAVAVGAYFLVPVSAEARGSEWLRVVLGLGLLLVLVVLVLRQVLLQIQHPDRRLDGLVVAIVVSVCGFALLFFAIATHRDDQFVGIQTRIDALYYTMSTLLTVGYGDVHATGQAARALVLLQMVFNVVVIATAVTTLSNQVRSRAVARAQARDEQRQAGRTQRNPR